MPDLSCEASGDQAAFTRAFAQAVGAPPRDWLKAQWAQGGQA